MGKDRRTRVKKGGEVKVAYTHGKKKNAIANAVVQSGKGSITINRIPLSSVEPKPLLDIHSRMFVKDGEKCHLVPLESIRYFESCKNYVRIFFGSENAFVKKHFGDSVLYVNTDENAESLG